MTAQKGESRGPARASAARANFVVEPFENTKSARLIDHLRFGLPALISERLGGQAPLRFAGGPEIFGRSAGAAGARYVIRGRFEREPDWKIAVTVEIWDAPGGVLASEFTRTGAKDEVERTAIEATWAAFMRIADLKIEATPPLAALAPFGRDPYAFALYGRGLAGYFGRGGLQTREARALELFRRSLLIDPKVAETRRILGVVHLEAGRPGHARAMWSSALEGRPDSVPTLRSLAALDRAQGLSSARDRYARLLELDAVDLEARRAYGELLAEAGDLGAAQKQLERVIESLPDDLRARRALALVLASRRAGHELAAELERLVKLEPGNLESRMDLGAAYLSVGRREDAASTYEEVLKKRPRHPGALKLAADLARDRGDLRRATTYYNKLRWLQPQDPRPVFLLGAAHYQAGNLDMAERLFTEGAQYAGMLPEAYANLGAIAIRRGQARQALWFLGRAAKRRPGKTFVRYNHALALHQVGRDADAANELHAAVAFDPTDSGVRFLSGLVALRLGLLRQAAESFQATIDIDPTHADARHNLALLAPLVLPKTEGSLTFIGGGAGVGAAAAVGEDSAMTPPVPSGP